jgi:hypothetical protein
MLILFLVAVDSILFLAKYKSKSSYTNPEKNCILLTISFENLPENIKNKIRVGDEQLLGKRVLATVKSIESIEKAKYKKDQADSFNLVLDIAISKNLLDYSKINLLDDIGFETGSYRLDGKLLSIKEVI